MSYDIARSFSINVSEKTFSGSFASNNITPRYYESYTYQFHRKGKEEALKHLTEKEVFLAGIGYNLGGGMIQLSVSSGIKYRYAILKLREYAEKKYNQGVYDIFKVIYQPKIDTKSIEKVKDLAGVFENLLKMKDKKINKVLRTRSGYLHKVTKTSIMSTPFKSKAKRFTSYKELEWYKTVHHKYVGQEEDY